MTSPFESAAPVERCTAYDRVSGRCQLLAEHHGPHATEVMGACMTWHGSQAQYWGLYPAPDWLIELPWVPGFQPPVHEAKRSAFI